MRPRCLAATHNNPTEMSESGFVVVHRDIAGSHDILDITCWCGPFLIDPMDLRTDDEIADAMNVWENGH